MRYRSTAAVFLLVALVPPRLPATQADPRRDVLFTELPALDERRDARAGQLQARIWYPWYEHDDAQVNRIMEAGLGALAQERYGDAVDAFTPVIELDPDLAEAWKRGAAQRPGRIARRRPGPATLASPARDPGADRHMELLLTLADPPGGTERCYNALRLAHAMLHADPIPRSRPCSGPMQSSTRARDTRHRKDTTR